MPWQRADIRTNLAVKGGRIMITNYEQKDAELFGCKAGIPAFRIMRTSTNSNGEIFECTIILAPGDRNRYEITLHRNDMSYKKII